jgi:hypothetical protein
MFPPLKAMKRTSTHIESFRADTRAGHVAIITQAIQFNDQDSKIFWPVYRKYEADLTKAMTSGWL